jgi:hypothetical protein
MMDFASLNPSYKSIAADRESLRRSRRRGHDHCLDEGVPRHRSLPSQMPFAHRLVVKQRNFAVIYFPETK